MVSPAVGGMMRTACAPRHGFAGQPALPPGRSRRQNSRLRASFCWTCACASPGMVRLNAPAESIVASVRLSKR